MKNWSKTTPEYNLNKVRKIFSVQLLKKASKAIFLLLAVFIVFYLSSKKLKNFVMNHFSFIMFWRNNLKKVLVAVWEIWWSRVKVLWQINKIWRNLNLSVCFSSTKLSLYRWTSNILINNHQCFLQDVTKTQQNRKSRASP